MKLGPDGIRLFQVCCIKRDQFLHVQLSSPDFLLESEQMIHYHFPIKQQKLWLLLV